MAGTFTQMGLFIKETGRMTNSMVMEKRVGLMAVCIRETMRKVGNMERESLCGQMAVSM